MQARASLVLAYVPGMQARQARPLSSQELLKDPLEKKPPSFQELQLRELPTLLLAYPGEQCSVQEDVQLQRHQQQVWLQSQLLPVQ